VDITERSRRARAIGEGRRLDGAEIDRERSTRNGRGERGTNEGVEEALED